MRGGRIFISYRRTDSPAHTGRLKDRLGAHFRERVFQDVDSISPGVQWDEEIARNLSESSACIVIIGPSWLNARDVAGNRRLDDPNDIVRQEIAVVLKRRMPVFPVLVGGATMPAEGELPADLQALCSWNAIEIPEPYWDAAVAKLIKSLEAAVAPSAEPRPAPSRGKWVLAACAILAAAIGVAAYIAMRPSSVGPSLSPPSTAAFQFAGNWRAVVSMPGRPRIDEDLVAYTDRSFRFVAQNSTAGIGKWQYNSGADVLELSDATDLATNAKYSCTWKNTGAAREGMIGACIDRAQNGWTVSLSRGPGRPLEPSFNVPHVDLSGFTTAEKVAFKELLGQQQCGCGMTLLVCLRTHPACPYRERLSQAARAEFLRRVHS
jgi:hypothetical protein